jgi:hypothetical protein
MPPDIDQHSFFATNAIFFLPLKTSCQDDCLTLAKKKNYHFFFQTYNTPTPHQKIGPFQPGVAEIRRIFV